ncbi:MAG: FtsQ-type POTRA domain-containing protein [Gammaproteobacteria bacterium]|nr:FtsQ-type POTRA domain-containing protein [Gammaproteobacteria bacterium]MCP4088609.1 FtsQ-type POTRA domain-containing protein [Gammaproteobacteria bacterium]MCP4276483.1 FtsQ-type POTRA domain-containing protein [Gammaproteobacteria bacterium]MCP4832360.1 FtsQ-type POTRA domain-containing protein [Gammaproteobacteria bacterium]MCP4929126.1 FtsQ-type POTRA domain-containing protein [Gammaproteobacteria bacterium]
MPRKRSNRRKSGKPVKRSFTFPEINLSRIGNAAVLILIGVTAWLGATWMLERPVNSVRIDGRFERVSAMQVEAAMMPYLGSGFLATDLNVLQKSITALPWVQDASVRRSWPSTLNVSITEEHAAACWGKDGLLNVYGELFVEHAKHIPAELPRLSGPAGSELQVARRFFELDVQLKQRGLNAVALAVDERGAWKLELSNGIDVRFGAVALEARTARFFEAFDQVLAPFAGKVGYVDMRYTNGFSIGLKPGDRIKLADAGETEPHA